MSNKGRLPALGLGAERPSTFALSSSHSFSLPPSSFSLSFQDRFPSPCISRQLPHLFPLSLPPLIIRNKNSAVRSVLRRLPICLDSITPSSTSSSPSASTFCASRRCLHPVAASVWCAGPWAEFECFSLHLVVRIEGFY